MISEKTFDEISEGDSAHFEVVITETLVDAFGALSGDCNPLHMDQSYGTQTSFNGRIAHGMIAGTLFSRLVGMHLPGKYNLYLSQTLSFKKPLHIGARVIVEGNVLKKSHAVRTLTLSTTVRDATNDEELVVGEALVRVLK
ncbi:MAG: MaoC family dehydratase [bacterium]|nr:MaoC family dehydratase [bacterium]